jgi:hypothetical protein
MLKLCTCTQIYRVKTLLQRHYLPTAMFGAMSPVVLHRNTARYEVRIHRRALALNESDATCVAALSEINCLRIGNVKLVSQLTTLPYVIRRKTGLRIITF